VTKILRLKIKGLDQKLRRAKQLVHDLQQKREELRVILVREERKKRENNINNFTSRGSSNSKTSISIDRGGHKWQMNWNDVDELNESFFSVNTSISIPKSPLNKDRTTSSIETSFMEGKSNRDNRFGQRKPQISRLVKRNKENHEDEVMIGQISEIKDTRDFSQIHQEYLSTNPTTIGNGDSYYPSEFGVGSKKKDSKHIFLKKNTPEWGEPRKTFPWEKKDFEVAQGIPDEIFLEKTHSKDSFAKREDLLKLINDIKEFDTGEKEDFEAGTFGVNILKETDSQ